MEEPDRLQSRGSLRVGHDWATSLSLFTFMHWRRTWQPTPVFLPGESQGRRSLVGCRLWGCTESDTTEVTQQQQQKQLETEKSEIRVCAWLDEGPFPGYVQTSSICTWWPYELALWGPWYMSINSFVRAPWPLWPKQLPVTSPSNIIKSGIKIST